MEEMLRLLVAKMEKDRAKRQQHRENEEEHKRNVQEALLLCEI